jgi:hypothetical protein
MLFERFSVAIKRQVWRNATLNRTILQFVCRSRSLELSQRLLQVELPDQLFSEPRLTVMKHNRKQLLSAVW